MGASRLCLAVLGTVLLGGASLAQTGDGRPETRAMPGDPIRGRGVVVGATTGGQQSACLPCHGIEGRGDAAAGFPRLDGQIEGYLVKSLRDYASGVRQNEIMTPIAKALTDQQRADVAAHYADQQAPESVRPPATTDAELLQRGAALAAIGAPERHVQACQNCHGPDGSGLEPSYPVLAGQYEAYLTSQLTAWKMGRRGGDPLDVMAVIARRLDERDIRAVAAYYGRLAVPGRVETAGATAAGGGTPARPAETPSPGGIR